MAYFRTTSLVLPCSGLLLGIFSVTTLITCADNDPGVVAVSNGAEEDEPEPEVECTLGEVRCDCREEAGNECDASLICLSGVCVEAEATSDESEPAPSEAEPEAPAPNPTTTVTTPMPTPVEPEPVPEPAVNEPEPMAVGGSGPSGPSGNGGSTTSPPETGGSAGETVTPSGGNGGTMVSVGGNPGVAGMSGTFDGGLIQNGDFASGDAFWKVDDGTGILVTHSTSSGSLCVQVGASLPYAYLGWPMDASAGVILSAASYEFSYDAWSTGAIQFSAKVGESSTPYTAHFESPVALTTQSQRYSHVFSPLTATASGVVFIVSAGLDDAQVCVDNVSLRAL